jgi:hypothetical protein
MKSEKKKEPPKYEESAEAFSKYYQIVKLF